MVIEAVVFDLDGVLVDSEPVWEQVRRQVVAEAAAEFDLGPVRHQLLERLKP